ncbi:MAG: hypothetical protein KAS32_20180 [Candidatus Peribacteraceae bacterium]|nr:hypothetical protein [Candidatus Peribacteraceae bacterium]
MNRSFRVVDDPNSLIEPVDDDWNDEDDNYLDRLGVSSEEAPEYISNNPFHEPPFSEPWYAPHGFQRPTRNLPSRTGSREIEHLYTDGINEISGMRTNRPTDPLIALTPTERIHRYYTQQVNEHGDISAKEMFTVDGRPFHSFDEALDHISESRQSIQHSNPSKEDVQNMFDEVYDKVMSVMYILRDRKTPTTYWDHIIERVLNEFISKGYIDAFSWDFSPDSFGKVLRLRRGDYVVRHEFGPHHYGY